MSELNYIYYQGERYLVGWLEEYPDYRTQGETLEELEENLRDLLEDLQGGHIPQVRRVGKLLVA